MKKSSLPCLTSISIGQSIELAKDNNLVLELQKSSRFWEDDPLMPENKDYYIERKSYENPAKV